MNAEALENERAQLLDHWAKRLKKNPDWISDELHPVKMTFLASNGDPEKQKSLGSFLRQFHDKLGFKAKHSLKQGGLCAGAIFRTGRFIETQERSGAKKGPEKTVHIEHTVPVTVLAAEIKERRFSNYTHTLAWLLKHSVATALHQEEENHLRERSRETGALNPTSPEYLKPFRRYEKLHGADGVVWNVFDRQEVDPHKFTFHDHLEIVMRLLEEAGAAKTMMAAIRNSSCREIEDGEHCFC
jgi:hypothetical protein